MSRHRSTAFWALGAVSTGLWAALATSAGCVAPAGPAPSGGAAPGATPEATVTCGTPGEACTQSAPCCPGSTCTTGTCTCPGSGQNGYNPNKSLYWGNLHQHTARSLDAYSWGARTMPSDAYVFAKGTRTPPFNLPPSVQVGFTGPTIHPQRTLDFLAITDHSEWLAVMQGCTNPQSNFWQSPSPYPNAATDCPVITAPGWYTGKGEGDVNVQVHDICGEGAECSPEYANAWSDLVSAANVAYDACSFTSLVAYEWTGMVDDAQGNVRVNHRNVIFNNAAAGTGLPETPCDSLYCASDPPTLWSTLDATCTSAMGCDVVTIPHNTNQSNGLSLVVWPDPGNTGHQARYQVAAEVYQQKGNSECYQGSGQYTSDTGKAGCGFEKITAPGTDQPGSYVRGGLELGIEAAAQGQPNPLQLGIVGATDDHNAAPGYVEEEVYVGHHGTTDDTPALRISTYPTYGSGGLTGVWAEQNTRDRVFAAIQRRETFATSGPRIQVRFYQATLGGCANFPDSVIEGGGVPMGGTFRNLTPGSKPTFVIAAWPDTYNQKGPATNGGVCSWNTDCPSGMDCCPLSGACNPGAPTTGNACYGPVGLSAVQVIKALAYVDANDNVVMTEDPPYVVPMTDSGITSAGGCTVWTDSGFSPVQHAFYYVRVLQQPTYRWSHWDCNPASGAAPAGCTSDAFIENNDTIQERAWTSPIWYTTL